MDEDPSEIIAELARKLSVGKLLADNPSLTRRHLKNILEDASKALGKKHKRAAVVSDSFDAGNSGEKWIVNVDGASRGNPGLAGAGAVIRRGGEKIELKKFLGQTTNNEAEYEALIMAIEEALKRGADDVELRCDSELMVKQMNGLYRVKAENLKPLYQKARGLADKLKKVTILHVKRNLNKEADELANSAIDTAVDH